MLIGREALEKTNWSRLSHAYGRATDTPQILRGLLTNDVAAHQKVVDHLYGTIIHQDTPWTATAPVALVLAGLLFEESVIHEVNDGDPEKNLLFLRGTLAGFLAATANAAVEAMDELETLKKQAQYNIDHYLDTGAYDQIWEDEDAAMALNARTILACVEAAPVLLDAVCTRLDDPDPRMRVCAAMAATSLCETVPLAHHKERIKARVLSMARSAEDSTERSALVLTLVDYNQADFLTDLAPAVRVCAALADCFREEDAAKEVLINAINEHAGEMDSWFQWHPPLFRLRPRFVVLRRLLYEKPIVEFERLAPGAAALAQITLRHFVDYEWGPLLQSAFPEHDGKIKSNGQRMFLRALVENSSLWSPQDAAPLRWFKQAGLPYDQRACKRLVKER